MTRRFLCLVAAALCLPAVAGERAALNDASQQRKPYVLLVGLDGFRFDYAERYGARNILALRDRGSSAEALIPSYPSKTFPSFYTLATGLHPQRHGIVSNRFWDPAVGKEFFFRSAGEDGSWYGGTPIWVLAEKQGMRTAAYFWPGTAAGIQGIRPSHYYPYAPNTPHERQVAQVLEWFRLPEQQRPHLVTLYFSDVDSAGHRYGPDAPETRGAVTLVDQTLGKLLAALASVRPQVNVILVSDHGMQACEPPFDLTGEAGFSRFRVVNENTQVMLYSEDRALIDATYRKLNGKSNLYRVFRRSETPRHLHYSENPRIGGLVIMSTGAHLLAIRPPGVTAEDLRQRPAPKGMHGWDPKEFPLMNGIFYAAGPQIRSGVRLPPMAAADVFPVIASILGLKAPKDLDAKPGAARRIVRR